LSGFAFATKQWARQDSVESLLQSGMVTRKILGSLARGGEESDAIGWRKRIEETCGGVTNGYSVRHIEMDVVIDDSHETLRNRGLEFAGHGDGLAIGIGGGCDGHDASRRGVDVEEGDDLRLAVV